MLWMKLPFQRLHKPQKDWFGKKGVSLHGAMFIFRDYADGPLMTEFHDNLSENDDKQNWFFTASCTEQSIVNFEKLHPEVVSATLWSDNGAHYKNTSLVTWLGHIFQNTGVKVTAFNNFEAQKGKTKLDSHYAVLKFGLKAYRHEGHDILSPPDIVAGTERLRGTNVYEITLDRDKEPQSAKTWQGISNYFSFVYEYSENGECSAITAQEQTGVGPTTRLKKDQIDNLWANPVSETGASTQFDLAKGKEKTPLIEKKQMSSTPEVQLQQAQECQTVLNNSVVRCLDCGACFLREGNLVLHKGSNICQKCQKSKRALATGQNLIRDDVTLASSLQKAKRFKDLAINKSNAEVNTEKQCQNQWNKMIQGKALKSHQGKRKTVPFSKQQIAVTIECYDKGKDLSKRYTPAMCQKEMSSGPIQKLDLKIL